MKAIDELRKRTHKTNIELVIIASLTYLPNVSEKAAEELEELRTLAEIAEEHRNRYNNNGTEYWNGRRDEAGWFRDKLRAVLGMNIKIGG